MKQNGMDGKQDQLDDYTGVKFDELQTQINTQKVELEQLRQRFKRLDNSLAIHLNKKNHKEVYEE